MFKKIVLFNSILILILISIYINIKSSESEYKEGTKVLSRKMAEKMIKENSGKLIALENDDIPKGYPYFVGYNNKSHKAIYAKNKLNEKESKNHITNIKYVGTWQYKGYWGVMISDQNGELVYCGDFGKNEPIGSKDWTYKKNAIVNRALSWGYPNVNNSGNKNDNYARTQLAIWSAQKSIDVSSSTLGVYQKVSDAYLNKIGVNENILSLKSNANNNIIDNLNMSNSINVSGNAKYRFEEKDINDLIKKDISIYVYENASKKYIKAIKNKLYSPSEYNNFRIATKNMNEDTKINDLKVLSDINPIEGYIFDNGKKTDQRIFTSVKQPNKTYNVNFNLDKQTGKISLNKILDKYGEYTNANGVEFGIFNNLMDAQNKSNMVEKMITNSEGYAISNELVAKEYYIREINGIENYNISNNITKVEVEKNITKEIDGNLENDNSTAFINEYKYGKLMGYKVLQDISLYNKPIKDNNDNIMFLTKNFKPVIIIDNDYILKTIRYPSKKEMIEKNLFNKQVVVEIPEYDYLYDEMNNIKINQNNIPYVKLKRDLNNNIIFKEEILEYQYPSKEEMDKLDRINNIEFSIYDENNKFIKSDYSKKINNENGVIEFNDLMPGKYTIKESSQSKKIKKNNKEYNVEIFANKTSYINEGKEIINNVKVGNLSINKINDFNEKLKNVVFAVYDKNKEKIIDYIISDKEGKGFYSNYEDIYYLKEIITNEKHDLSSDYYKINIKDQDTYKINITNKVISKYVNVSKVDITDENELEGARMCLTSQNADKFNIFVDNKDQLLNKYCWTSKSKPKKMKLYYGKYYIEEKIAPKNYIKTNTLIPVIINDKGVMKVKVKNEAIKINIPKSGKSVNQIYLSLSMAIIFTLVYISRARNRIK